MLQFVELMSGLDPLALVRGSPPTREELVGGDPLAMLPMGAWALRKERGGRSRYWLWQPRSGEKGAP